MTVLSGNDVTLAKAISLALPFWRLEISNWGNRQTGAASDGTSLRYPGDSTTLQASAQLVAIGPDSTADEVIMEYASFVSTAFVVPKPGRLDQQSFTVGLQKPGIVLPGGYRFRTSYSTQFTDFYVKDGVPGAVAFGTDPAFEAPTLQVLVYPQGSPLVGVPAKRNLMYRNTQVAFAAGTSETTLALWPVMGRGCKAVYVRASDSLVGTVRVGFISSFIGTSGVITPVPNIVEKTMDSGPANGTTAVAYRYSSNAACQWLALYFTRTSGSGFIHANLIASDEGC